MSGDEAVSLLYVDPDEQACLETRTDLEASPLLDVDVRTCSSLSTAIETLEADAIDCVVTEYELSDATGIDLLDRLRDDRPDVPCILYTDVGPDAIHTGAARDAVVEYLPRDIPDPVRSLARLVRNVLDERSQLAYPLPETEDERLAAIQRYDVDDLEATTAVDRLTELLANHFDVAVAFVGIVDAHEERFLACKGADWDRLDREDAICSHTLLEDEHLIVEHVQSDARFADIEVLAELDIRSYAGVPLTTPDGLPIGAMCLIHDEPRSYSDDDIEDLHRFAEELMEQLELRRRLSDVERAVPKPDHEGIK
ncbi:GAF domain-containing protein [Halapricum desulfuricans]|uniref:Signal transduction protein n=1 Tax=Halapricum desulfuricans TaxID=2841257 RepID=A0A897NSY1_9EURY|nr:GAF domain-containing protein [Halapricum desulfuricans]QSG15887.1 Signal transduction protein [Halapricum desulfuricans]